MEEPKLRVVIVEDERELRTVLIAILSRLDLDVRGAGDGGELDQALAERPADVVVLDLNLPGEDGVSIAQRLRRSSGCGIIMTTSRAQIADRVDGFEKGADLYFVKPIDPLELHAALISLGRRLKPPVPSAKPVWHFDRQESIVRSPRGVVIHLTAQECIVLRLVFAVPGETVRRSEIFTALGHPDCQAAQWVC
ncbi:MAG TPA: response regulator transcription factor [Desulfuromonadales bacterium]|nr:response regulator transcription factor [Desulfuromonadales bacterium]